MSDWHLPFVGAIGLAANFVDFLLFREEWPWCPREFLRKRFFHKRCSESTLRIYFIQLTRGSIPKIHSNTTKIWMRTVDGRNAFEPSFESRSRQPYQYKIPFARIWKTLNRRGGCGQLRPPADKKKYIYILRLVAINFLLAHKLTSRRSLDARELHPPDTFFYISRQVSYWISPMLVEKNARQRTSNMGQLPTAPWVWQNLNANRTNQSARVLLSIAALLFYSVYHYYAWIVRM